MKHKPIPADFPVRPLKPGDEAKDKATCGTCGISWDDAIITAWTPAPSARCPFEYFHVYDENKGLEVSNQNLIEIIQEFVSDVEAVGLEYVSEEWFDLYITYLKARKIIRGKEDGIWHIVHTSSGEEVREWFESHQEAEEWLINNIKYLDDDDVHNYSILKQGTP